MHRQKPALRAERRAQVRYPYHSEASCRLLATEAGASWPAAFENLSCRGAMLLMDCEVRPGAVLEVVLGGHGGRFSRPLLMRVRNVRSATGITWQVGCSFVRPLTAHDLEVLLLEPVSRHER